MGNGYHVDGSTIGIDEFFSTLREENLSPGRRILLENQAGALQALRSAGIHTLADLVASLKTSKRIAETSKATALNPDYCTILRRQAQSWFPQPVALSRFAGVPEPLVTHLKASGVTHSAHLFDAVRDGSLPDEASAHPDCPALTAMADLSRIPGIGPLFARAFVEGGYASVEKLAGADPHSLRTALAGAPSLAGYKGADVTEWDLRFCIWFARLLSAGGAVVDQP